MKVSAINSNYQTKKSLKNNQLNNNPNMSTPSFEGMNKINKVSAKKLALALMAGIAVTTPTLQSCATLDNVVNEVKDFADFEKKDYYIDPEIAFKYPNIDREANRNFDLFRKKFVNFIDDQKEIYGDATKGALNEENCAFFYSLDAQLTNYYVQNPDEKNLPNEEIIQYFVDNYNENKDFDKYKGFKHDKQSYEQAQKILNHYRKISKKYNISEQEAVWQYVSPLRYVVTSTPYAFANSVNLFFNMYSPEAIDEINTRQENTLIHSNVKAYGKQGWNMSVENNKFSTLVKDWRSGVYKGNIENNSTPAQTNEGSTVAPQTNKSYATDTITDNSATNSETVLKRYELNQKKVILEFNINSIKNEIKDDKKSIKDNEGKISSNKEEIYKLEDINTRINRNIQSESTNYELATAPHFKINYKNRINSLKKNMNENFATIRKLEEENKSLEDNSKSLEKAININEQKLQQAETELASIKRELNELQ